jgi:WbqC-like protein
VIVSIHQPGYLPWHGLFHRLALSDVHILLDSVQFEKNGFNNRVKVKTAQGATWLTVPVLTKGRFGNNRISDTAINNDVKWRESHHKTILYNYSKAPCFREYWPFFEQLYSRNWSVLAELNIHAIEYLARALGIRCQFVRASALTAGGSKADLVISLCKAVEASVYVSGVNGRDYLDRSAFQREGIALRFQVYREPLYPQLYGGFQPFMSVVDLLFNHGPEGSAVMMAGQGTIDDGTSES